MKFLVFTTNIYGHFVEYIHHLCEAAVNEPNNDIYIYVPSTFIEKKAMLKWPDSNNIHFDYFEESDVDRGGYLYNAYLAARILGRKVKEVKPDSVILLAIMQVMPFVAFFVPRGVKLYGIVYNIYLYKWKANNLVKKAEDIIKYWLFSNCSKFSSIFILNDCASAKVLNRIWRCEKFCYLPDPCPMIDSSKVTNIRSDLKINNDEKVFLHFGSLTKRKGAMMVLDIISRLPVHVLEKTCFIFAGRIWEDLEAEFYQRYEIVKNRAHIIIFDQFCTYEFFGCLCKSSDYIILPYKNTSNSSGIISYGAQFGVPVIVPSGGLVPKLVKKYRMGNVVKGDFVEEMLKEIPSLLESHVSCSNSYLNGRSVSDFAYSILSHL